MKKIIALVLSLMMMLGCVSALAETAEKETLTMLGSFEVKYNKLPDYYTMQVVSNTDMEYQAVFTSSDLSKPLLVLDMAFNDEWDGVNTLADVSEADMAAIQDTFYRVAELDEGDITFENAETGLGTPVLIAREVNGALAAIYTIYLSHEIEIDIFPTEDAGAVTDEDVQTLLAFLTDVEFVPLSK